MYFETVAIHTGQEPDPATGAVTVPVYQTSTYRQDAIGRLRGGYEYSRTGNPTRTALETALAALENGRYGLAFASGSAATAAVFGLLKAGDHVIASRDLYGGTYRLLERVFRRWQVTATYVDGQAPENFRCALQANTRLIWLESPTNPLLQLTDLRAVAAIARETGVLLAVDNTFATPFCQRPLELGADLVVHSTTKYLAGHSDVIGGAVITSHEKAYRELKFLQNAEGGVPGPWDSWLILRGLKTLAIRMREHEQNARFLAQFLYAHSRVERVYYPGLSSHPQYELAKSQMSGFGGMISFELKGGYAEVEKVVSRLKLFFLAESLGGVESLICHPARMTHASIPEAERRERGIHEGLLRLSVGIENRLDLQQDLEQALA